MSYYKDLIHEIKYVTDTKDYFYLMKPDGNLNGPWELHYYRDTY